MSSLGSFRLFVAVVVVSTTSACDRETATSGRTRAAPAITAAPEESPEAKTPPAPLSERAAATPTDPATGASSLTDHDLQVPFWRSVRPFPQHGPVQPRPLPPGDLSGVELDAIVRWPELRKAHGDETVGPKFLVRLSPRGAIQVTLDSNAFALPRGTEFRGRGDHWGHVVVWPDDRSYRVVPVGALRATLEERRVDVTPLFEGEARRGSEGRRLGMATKVREVKGGAGSMEIEVTSSAALAGAESLFCRFLVELARIRPTREVCPLDELPLRAKYTWPEGGTLEVEVTAVRRLGTVEERAFALPPAMPIYKPGELPPRGPLTPMGAAAPPGSRHVEVRNETSLLQFVLAGGHTHAVLEVGEQVSLDLPKGADLVARDFLGEAVLGAITIPADGPTILGKVTPRPAGEASNSPPPP